MAKIERSTALYKTPFSRGYWKDAASELTFTKMLVVTALMTALRIALKPLAIPLGPSLSIQTAMLATALGAMIYGPVVAIPAAIISDTVGFMIYPTGDYFLPFVLTEIASTLIYALFLYRSKVSPTRVMLARFCICFLVNVVLQQFVYAWYYLYMKQPEAAMDSIMGIMTTTRIFKNLFFFPIETVVLTLFLKVLLPVTQRAKLTFCQDADMTITKKQIIAMVCLILVGVTSAYFYLSNLYTTRSRSADYSTEERVEANHAAADLVLEKTNDWDAETVVCVVDSAYRPLFGKETDYTIAVYVLDVAKFEAGVKDNELKRAEDKKVEPYTMDTLWTYSKSGPKKDAYGSLVKVASVTYTVVEKTGEILEFTVTPVE